jgi:hypothetical protein
MTERKKKNKNRKVPNAVPRKATQSMRKAAAASVTATERRLEKKAATLLNKDNLTAVTPQPEKMFWEVSIDDLRVDNSYQRPIKEPHVGNIMMYFSWEGFGTPVVGRRSNGTLWLLDGLQRITAAKNLNCTDIIVEVIDSRGPKHEAGIFHCLNAVSRVPTKMQIFRAGLRAGNATATAIYKATKAAGMDIQLDASNAGSNIWPQVRALSRLEQLYKFRGPEFVTEVLSLIKELWDGESDAVREDIIGGLHRFIRYNRRGVPRPVGWLTITSNSAKDMTHREYIVDCVRRKGLSAEGLHNKASNSKESASGYSRAEAIQRILEDTCPRLSRRSKKA